MPNPTPKNVMDKLVSVKTNIKEILESVNFGPDKTMDVDFDNPDEVFISIECGYILSKLEDILHQIDYLSKPVVEEGTLYKKPNGRFAISENYEFSPGSLIEVMVHDHVDQHDSWVETRIEEVDGDYYFHHLDVPLEGTHARRRV